MARSTFSQRLAAVAILLTAGPAVAQTGSTASPAPVPVVDGLYACRLIAEPAQRLACFDSAVTALQTAVQSRDIRIVDRDTAQRADEALARPAPIETVDSVLRSIGADASQRMILVLENGQRWVHTTGRVGRVPRPGEPVHIERGIMGSFTATVGTRPPIRVAIMR